VPPSTVVPSTTVWTASGPASFSVDKSGATGTAKFSYDAKNYVKDTVSTWTFRTTAVTEGTMHADVTYGYHHDWCNATAKVDAFVKDTTGAVVWTKSLLDSQNPCTASPFNADDEHRLVTAVEFPVKVNSVYGFTVSGSNHDNDHHLEGSLTASNLATTTPAAPPPLFSVTPAELNDQNTSWTTAADLPGGATGVDGTLGAPGEARWYKFPVQPGGQVQVDLGNLKENYDLTMFKDIGAAFTTLATNKDLTKLSAQFAADAYSPSIYSPSIYSPSIYSPSIYSPSIYSPSIYSPSIYSPSIYSPSQAFLDAFASAQTRSLLAVSAREGASPESIRTATWNNTGYYYVRVYGRNGISSPQPFHLGLTTTGGPCTTTPAIDAFANTATIAGTPGSATTVILTDSVRLPQTAAMSAALANLATATDGVIVDVSQSNRVTALNTQADTNYLCAYAKNLVAQSIRDIVNSYRDASGRLKYVVIAGGDSVIPFFRYADGAGIGPESDYVPPVRDTTASNTSLQGNYSLGQDAYGSTTDLSLRGGDLPIPDLAVGRLVENADEITSAINTYVSAGPNPTIAPIVPTSSLVTGYDFLTSAADAVQANLSTSLGVAADTLITDPNVKATTTTVNGTPDRGHSWTAADLKSKLSTHHDVVFLAGHFSANSALAADYSSSIITTDLADGTFTRSLVFSAGCHSGYNLLDSDGVPNLTLGLDWAEAMAKQGATFIGGTGYQYADTDFLAYSAKIYALLSDQLRSGSGAVSVGQALVKAKQAYLASIGNPTGIDQKSLIISTLFGLPMVGVDLPGARLPAASSTGVTTSPIPTGPAKVLGTSSYTLNLNPSLATNSKQALDLNGNPLVPATDFFWLSGHDGVQTGPGLPALPKEIVDVTSNGEVLRGVGFFGGTYNDQAGVLPLTGAPTTEQNGIHTNFVSPVFYPQKVATVNYTDDLGPSATQGRTSLVVNAAQYRSDPGNVTNTVRGYTNLGLQLFYSKNTTTYEGGFTPALAAAPSISAVSSTGSPSVQGGSVSVSAHVSGDPSAGIQKVWVTYTGETGPAHGSWVSVDLVQDATDSTLWKGTFALDPVQTSSDIRFIVQALNGVGMVSLDNNLGAYYTPGVAVGALAAPTATIAFDTTVPTSGQIGSTVHVGATLSPLSGNPAIPAGTAVTFSLGSVSATGSTDSAGHAAVDLPLQDAVGSYQLIAASAGATASTPFSIVLAQTHLTLEAPTPTRTPQVAAVLTDDGGRPIGEQTVILTVKDSAATVVRQAAVITDPAGRASLGSLMLADGTYSVSASFAGTPTRYLASSAFGSLLVDNTGPNVVGVPDTAGLFNDWYHAAVTVHWTCTDAGAGVTDPCADTSIGGADGEGVFSSTITVADVLGNTTTSTSPTVRIDRAPPTTLINLADVSTAWAGDSVPVTLTPGDALSGVAATYYTVDGGTQVQGTSFTVSGDGSHPISWWSVDVAGNIETTHNGFVRIDSKGPSISHTYDKAPNAAGWNNTPVTVHFVCSAPSGIASCSPDFSVTTDVTGTPVSGTAVSKTGKITNEVVLVNVDTIAPKVVVSGVVSGKEYDLSSIPTAVCTTTDERSGVQVQATAANSIVGNKVTVTCSGAKDVADNVGASASATYTVDDVNATNLSKLATRYVKQSNLANTKSVTDKLNNDLKAKKYCTFILDVKALSGLNLTPAQVTDLTFWARRLDPTCPA
jgi:hypothetical protein